MMSAGNASAAVTDAVRRVLPEARRGRSPRRGVRKNPQRRAGPRPYVLRDNHGFVSHDTMGLVEAALREFLP